MDKTDWNILDNVVNCVKCDYFNHEIAYDIVKSCYGTDSKEYKLFKKKMEQTKSQKDINIICESIHTLCFGVKNYNPPVKPFKIEIFDRNCYRILNKCKIVLVSDWATGNQLSLDILKQIKLHQPNYFIHLGDVYHTGRIEEQKKNLIEPLEKHLPKTRVFIIPGNHDYYSGSKGVEYTLNEIGQNSSFFSLYNKFIQFQGMDTGYLNSNTLQEIIQPAKSYGVMDEELEWHKDRIITAKRHGRKVILLSHHSPISRWSPCGYVNNMKFPVNPILFGQFEEHIEDVSVWFFGHEHKFDLIKPYTYNNKTIIRPRLIGNGSSQDDSEYIPYDFKCDKLKIPRTYKIYPGERENMLNPSFTVITIDEGNVLITYYEVSNGKSIIMSTEII